MKSFRRAVEALNLAVGYVCGLGILLMGLILAYEVVCRYFFGSPTVWAQEMSVCLFMWTMLAGCAYTLMKGGHVRIDLLFDSLPEKARLFLDIVTGCAGAVFCAVVSWQAWEMIASSLRLGKVSPTLLRVPLWIPQMSLLIGFGLLTFQFVFIIADRARALTESASNGGVPEAPKEK